MPAGSARGSPSVCRPVGSPAAAARRTRPSTWTRLGCGASARSSSWRRSTPSSRRSSVSASRPVDSAVANAVRARSGSRSASRRAAPAWIVIAEMACATTSCSSPAIRVRSSSAAASASALALAVELLRLLHERLVERLAVAHQLPEDERAADGDQAREDEGLHLVGVRVDRDGRTR